MEIYFQEKDTGRRSALWESFPNPALAYRALCQLPRELYLSHNSVDSIYLDAKWEIAREKLPEVMAFIYPRGASRYDHGRYKWDWKAITEKLNGDSILIRAVDDSE